MPRWPALPGCFRCPALCLQLARAVGDRQPCQLKVGDTGWRLLTKGQADNHRAGRRDRQRKGRPISALKGFVVCLRCCDRRGVDLEGVEGTIKDDISLKGVLYGVTERLLSSVTGCVFFLTCPSTCLSSPLWSETFGGKWQDGCACNFCQRYLFKNHP